MLIIPLVVVIFAWYLIICWKWKKNFFDPVEKLPGEKWLPVFGTTYGLIGIPRSEIFYRLVEGITKYRPLFRSWNGKHPEINIMKPEHLQVVLRSSSHLKKGIFYDSLYDWLGNGLLISQGAKWFMQRKLLTPTFHFKILETFMQVFVEKSRCLLNDLESKLGQDYFDIFPMITDATLDVICETAMGLPASAITNDKARYLDALSEMTELANWRNMKPYFRWHPVFYVLPQGRKYRRALKVLHEFSGSVISQRKALRKPDSVEEVTDDCCEKKRLSFLDLVMKTADDPSLVTDKDLRGLVDTFLFAGFDTTRNSTSWSIFLMGNHPEVQEKVFEEVRSVLGDKPCPTTMEELNKLRYLECVIKEALRLFPVLGIITRELSEDIELDGFQIPAGAQAILHIGMVHRDPEHFPEPDKFIPERFLPENSRTRHPFAYIPFSAGPRNCIGQRFALAEEKTMLASLINNYRITSMLKVEEMRVFTHTVIRPQHGIKIKIEKREY